LYIDETQTLYVSDRTAGGSVAQTFYGQGAFDGIEDVIELNNVRNGMNRLFNYWAWDQSTATSSDSDSVDKFGVKKKSVNNTLITDSGKITTILNALRDEFKDLKQELDFKVPFDFDTLGHYMLDRIAISYPPVYAPAFSGELPLYGTALYDVDYYPFTQFTLEITTDTNYKIIGRNINLKNQTITFKVREI
jgi:hypothetical protein